MLMPRRVKHRKVMRGRMSGLAKGGHSVAFGDYGLATLEPAWITSRQIEAARRAMTRSVKRGGKIWIRIFPDKPATKKPAETRMGSGKGAPDHWVAVVKPGRILFEMAGIGHDEVDMTVVVSVARLARHRLYKRVIRLTTKFKAHDEANDAHVGDTVLIEESRPLSATKRWRLIEVVTRAGEQAGEQILAEEAATEEAIHGAAHPGRHQAGAEAR